MRFGSFGLTMYHKYKLYIILNVLCSISAYEKNWWRSTIIYEIFIKSFKDSNGDGIGDMKGITSKLDHFTDLHIDSIWITPFYESPQVDSGYDITNFTRIDPTLGTMEDFEELTREAKKRGIKVIIDCVINHSSHEMTWFKKSIERIKPYDDYYIWRDPKGFDSNHKPIPPNNWTSGFRGSAWQWNEKREQFYLHKYYKEQPDFNMRNEYLKKELKAIMKFWFDKGVAGLRMDAAPEYIEDRKFRDEPLLDPTVHKQEYEWTDFDHIYTRNLWENLEFIHELRLFVDEYNRQNDGYERIMVAEVYANMSMTMAYYGTKEYPIVHFPFNFDFTVAEEYYNAETLHRSITEWLDKLPKNSVTSWVAENHDRARIGSRIVNEYTIIINILMMMLPGVPVLYYGEEICMIKGALRKDQLNYRSRDSYTGYYRDLSRTPMQWDDSFNAGFTSKKKPWLPVNPNYWYMNVESQKKNKNSCYNNIKDLSLLRKTNTFKYGSFNSYIVSPWIYSFTRTLKGHDTFVVVINLGSETEIVNLYSSIPNLQSHLKVLIASDNSGYKKGDLLRVKSQFPHLLIMNPFSALVLSSSTSKH